MQKKAVAPGRVTAFFLTRSRFNPMVIGITQFRSQE